MELVQLIRDKKQIQNMKRYLKSQNIRDWLLFTLGINSGLRISDLLDLQVEDVAGRDRVVLREKKTWKSKNFPLSQTCQRAIREYLSATGLQSGPLFPSQKSGGSGATGRISRQQAYHVINAAARAVGLSEQIGTHSMRKTFGYHAYQAGADLTLIQHLLNHASPGVTLRYIGITQDNQDKIYMDLNL